MTLIQSLKCSSLIPADMTRQYKTMQTEMGLRIHQLETELQRTRAQLGKTTPEAVVLFSQTWITVFNCFMLNQNASSVISFIVYLSYSFSEMPHRCKIRKSRRRFS